MAESKTTTTRKPRATKAKTTAKTAEAKTVEVKTEVKAEPRKYEQTDLIPVVSVFPGLVCLGGQRSKLTYYWCGPGEVSEIEYQDLVPELRNKNSHYFYDPMLIVQDDELVEKYPNLKALYEKMYSPEEIEKVLLSGKIKDVREMFNAMPKGMAQNSAGFIATLIQDGKLDSVGVVREVDKILGTELELTLSFEH